MYYTDTDRWELMREGAFYALDYLRNTTIDGVGMQQDMVVTQLGALAERMVDFKCGSIARKVRLVIDQIQKSGAEWPESVLDLFGKLYTYATVVGNSSLEEMNLKPEWLSWGGWALRKEVVMSIPGIKDDWIVLGTYTEKEEQLRVARTWMWARHHKRLALHIDYLVGPVRSDKSWSLGKAYHGKLHFYPGHYNLRCVAEQMEDLGFVKWPTSDGFSLNQIKAYAADALGHFPLLEHLPVFFKQANVALDEEGNLIIGDASGRFSNIEIEAAPMWTLVMLGLEQPIELFGELNAGSLRILSVGFNGEFHRLS